LRQQLGTFIKKRMIQQVEITLIPKSRGFHLVTSEIMRQLPGVYGGRFSGAGFKGACIALVDPSYKEEIQKKLTEKYLEQFPEYEKTFQVFWVRPDDGARFVD
jgi:galactokinase